MKNLLSFTFAAALCLSVISCGPSEKEKTADSLHLDSTAKDMADEGQRMIDSINRVDSMNNANNQRVADSLRLVREADSIAKLKKK